MNTFSTTDNVRSIKTGAGNDQLSLTKVTKSINTGAGNDKVGNFGGNVEALIVDKGATVDLLENDDYLVEILDSVKSLAV